MSITVHLYPGRRQPCLVSIFPATLAEAQQIVFICRENSDIREHAGENSCEDKKAEIGIGFISRGFGPWRTRI